MGCGTSSMLERGMQVARERDALLAAALQAHAEVWIITGTGHHTDRAGHQVAGGVLRAAVIDYLHSAALAYHPGKDQGGHVGAFIIRGKAHA